MKYTSPYYESQPQNALEKSMAHERQHEKSDTGSPWSVTPKQTALFHPREVKPFQCSLKLCQVWEVGRWKGKCGSSLRTNHQPTMLTITEGTPLKKKTLAGSPVTLRLIPANSERHLLPLKETTFSFKYFKDHFP